MITEAVFIPFCLIREPVLHMAGIAFCITQKMLQDGFGFVVLKN